MGWFVIQQQVTDTEKNIRNGMILHKNPKYVALTWGLHGKQRQNWKSNEELLLESINLVTVQRTKATWKIRKTKMYLIKM